MAKKSPGKKFEESIEESCNKENIFYDRKRDVYLPPELRGQIPLPKNKYDCFIFAEKHLFPLELKSSGQKSVSILNADGTPNEKIIKEYQIKSLVNATAFGNIIPGLIFNFREFDNCTYFVYILDFIKYRDVLQGKSENCFKCKINKSSISIDVCDEIGLQIKNNLKRTNYHYFISDFIQNAIKKYGGSDLQ